MRRHSSGLWADGYGGIHRPDGSLIESDFYRIAQHRESMKQFHCEVAAGKRSYDVMDWVDFVDQQTDLDFFNKHAIIDA